MIMYKTEEIIRQVNYL